MMSLTSAGLAAVFAAALAVPVVEEAPTTVTRAIAVRARLVPSLFRLVAMTPLPSIPFYGPAYTREAGAPHRDFPADLAGELSMRLRRGSSEDFCFRVRLSHKPQPDRW